MSSRAKKEKTQSSLFWRCLNIILLILNREILFVGGPALWILARVITCFAKRKKKVKLSLAKEIILGIFVLYLFLLAGVTLFPININLGDRVFLPAAAYINYIPGVSIIRSINVMKNIFSIGFELKILIMNVGGNLFLLTPLSILLPIIWNKCSQFKWCFAFCFLTSLLIETFQLVENILGVAIGRICDIDDLILNSIGVVIGYFIYKCINSKLGLFRSRHRTASSAND